MGGENDTGPKPLSPENLTPSEWLRNEYAKRRRRNPSYSVRAFARQLSLSSGPLTELLNSKRPFTEKTAERIAACLGLSGDEKAWLLDGVRQGTLVEPRRYETIDDDRFSLIADWYHYAILSLLETRLRSHSARELAKKLSITPIEAETAIDRLLRLGLLRRQRGRLIPTTALATNEDIPSDALRHFHRQVLQQAERSLDAVPVAERDVSSITMAIDRKKIPEAKRLIREFRRKLAGILESGDRTDVYHLAIQLIPAKGNR